VKPSAVNHRDEHTHTHTRTHAHISFKAVLMNLQRWGRCPGVELAAECELSPRGEGANTTQRNTNKPLRPVQEQAASQPVSQSVGAELPVETSPDNEESHALTGEQSCRATGPFLKPHTATEHIEISCVLLLFDNIISHS